MKICECGRPGRIDAAVRRHNRNLRASLSQEILGDCVEAGLGIGAIVAVIGVLSPENTANSDTPCRAWLLDCEHPVSMESPRASLAAGCKPRILNKKSNFSGSQWPLKSRRSARSSRPEKTPDLLT